VQSHCVTFISSAHTVSPRCPSTWLCLAGVVAVAWPAQPAPVGWVVRVQALGYQLVACQGMVVGVQRGGEAAGGAVTTWSSVLVDADAERVASEHAWAEAGAVAMAVATLC
jgi:hypothetical protein